MKNQYCCNLNDLLSIFEDNISAADVLAAKALSEVSAAIVKQRVEMGMTQKQFAQFMNVSQGMISKWESADYNFSIKTLADIAAKLDVDLNIRMQKSKVISLPDIRQFSSITSIENRIFMIYNSHEQRKQHSFSRSYIENSEPLKIMVK